MGKKLEQAINKPLEAKNLTPEESARFKKEWEELEKVFNKPAHYHQHNIDTIQFLQEGFPPDVFMGFAIGHIIKYAQRANYKNGREDFVKMLDYSKRALDWYDKTHS
jgi:hypothetical protein